MHRLLAFAAVYLTLLAAATGQQSGSVSGVVRDAVTGERLPFVNILAEDGTGTATGPDGTFQMSGLALGKQAFTASSVGYQTLTLEQVSITVGKSAHVAFELRPAVVEGSEVVVTATRKPQAVRLAPASVVVVTASQIAEKHLTTFDQALDDVPGVVITRSSGSNVQALSIRGASEVAGGGIGNRVLLLVDGRPALSPESAGALWNLVPLAAVERIEVVKGAYSSLYGSSAMGGVVNVITRTPTAQPQTKLHAEYGAYGKAPASTGYSRFSDYHTIGASHSRNLGRFAYLLDGGWKHNDGHREKSGFDLVNLYGKATYSMRGNRFVQLSLNANGIHNDTPATWLSKRQAYSVADFRKDDFQDRREQAADFYYYALPNSNLKYSTRTYYYRNHSRFSFDDNPDNDSTNVNIGKQVVERSSVQTQRLGNISQVEWFLNERHALLGGTDLNFDRVVGLPDSVLYGTHHLMNFGAYLQDECSLTEQLTFTIGARADHFRIPGEYDETNFSPKLAVLFAPKKQLALRMLLAQAFRNPAVAERYIKFEQGGGLSFEPNPDLHSERLVLSAELGLKLMPSANTNLDVAFFHNQYRGLISYQQVSKPLEPLRYKVVNLKEAIMRGVEVTLNRQVGEHLRMNAGYTYLDARDISEGRVNDELAYKPRHTLSVAATGRFGKFSAQCSARYRSRIAEVFIYPGSEPDAAFILNGKLTWQPLGGLSTYLAADNLTDTQYEEIERYRMPGRSLTAGFSWEF